MTIWIRLNGKQKIPGFSDKFCEVNLYGNQAADYKGFAVKQLVTEAADPLGKQVVVYRLFIDPEMIDDEMAQVLLKIHLPVILAGNPDSEVYLLAIECLIGHGVIPVVRLPILSGHFSTEDAETFYHDLVEHGITSMELENVSGYYRGDRYAALKQYDQKCYGDLLVQIFTLWWKDRMAGLDIRIREFENLAGAICGNYLFSCGISGTCEGCLYMAESGELVSCDRYFLKSISRECKLCRWASICHQGCALEYPVDAQERNYFCDAYKRYYEYAIPRMFDLLRALKR